MTVHANGIVSVVTHKLIELNKTCMDAIVKSLSTEFQCCYFCESSCLFYLSFNFDFYVSKIMHL